MSGKLFIFCVFGLPAILAFGPAIPTVSDETARLICFLAVVIVALPLCVAYRKRVR